MTQFLPATPEDEARLAEVASRRGRTGASRWGDPSPLVWRNTAMGRDGKPHLRKLGAWWYCGVPHRKHSYFLTWQGATPFEAWQRWSANR